MIDESIYPVGSIVQMASCFPMPQGWRPADGSRLRRRDDPVLYDLLRPTFRNRWRRWIVHLPDFTERSPQMLPGIRITYIIKGSR